MAKDKNVAVARKANVSAEQFVSAFMTAFKNGEGRHEVAKALGVGYQTVVIREKSYREKGVKLPELVAGSKGRKVDIGAANALIASLTAPKAEEKPAE